MAACPPLPVSSARPSPASLRSVSSPKPAAVRFKAAFRAALRPESADLGMAGPRPARGLKALLGRKPTLLALALPDPEAPVFPPVCSDRARREGRQGAGLSLRKN